MAVLATACTGDGPAGDPIERAVARSEAVAAGTWSYGQDTLPPAQGEREARLVERCRLTLPAETGDPGAAGDSGDPDASGASTRTTDVECGRIFVGLEADADSAWVDRLMTALDAEVVDRGAIPGWATALDEPVRYLLVRVETGREASTLERALGSEGVRFVDVREVARRRP